MSRLIVKAMYNMSILSHLCQVNLTLSHPNPIMLGAPSVQNIKMRPTTLEISYEQPTHVAKMCSSSRIKGFPMPHASHHVKHPSSYQARIIHMVWGRISKTITTVLAFRSHIIVSVETLINGMLQWQDQNDKLAQI